ncbi:MAG: hypothetical protein ACRELY_08605, partial [Polyangiaceae bacterium]
GIGGGIPLALTFQPSEGLNKSGGGGALEGLGLAACGLSTVFGAIFAVNGILFVDGTPADHVISKFDAELYVARYNRALLRRTIEDTQVRMRQLSSGNNHSSPPQVNLRATVGGLQLTF